MPAPIASSSRKGISELPDGLEEIHRVLSDAVGIPFTAGNAIDILVNGNEIFPAMLEAIESSEVAIEFLTFVYWRGDIAQRFAETLAARARAGVRVRVLLDAHGASLMKDELVALMESAGVEVAWFRPRTWKLWRYKHRTHRKILVCDGKVAFTGGVGIAEEWCGDARDANEWRDTHFRVRGPAVPGLRAAFWGNWCETGRPLDLNDSARTQAEPCGRHAVQVVRTTSAIGWSDAAILHRTLLRVARERVRITTGYFVPDERALELIREAEARGVEVEVLAPGAHTDARISKHAGEDDLARVLGAGARVFHYQPTVLHAKTVTVDGVASLIGSPNFNQRSAQQDDEVALVVLDADFTAALDAQFDRDLERSEEVQLAEWRERNWWKRLREWLASHLRHEV